jgi:hypothetical protein
MYFLLKQLNTSYRIWIVTASTASLARKQLGPLFNEVERVYCCSGAERWENGKLISFKEWLPKNPRTIVSELDAIANTSEFHTKIGNHVDVRTSAISLSLTGNSANALIKSAYQNWDATTGERDKLVNLINSTYNDLEARKSGQVSIIVTPPGFGKHIILEDADDVLWFWGDEIDSNGNDATIASAVESSGGRVFRVSNPSDTYKSIRQYVRETVE